MTLQTTSLITHKLIDKASISIPGIQHLQQYATHWCLVRDGDQDFKQQANEVSHGCRCAILDITPSSPPVSIPWGRWTGHFLVRVLHYFSLFIYLFVAFFQIPKFSPIFFTYPFFFPALLYTDLFYMYVFGIIII